MNSVILGGLIKRLYPEFDMNTFSNRLRLQKIIYLMQADGFSFGYNFSYYLRGPYSTDLTSDGFNADFKSIKPLEFSDQAQEDKFIKFIEFISPHQEADDWLEIAASIHLLHKLYPSKSEAELIIDVKNKSSEMRKKDYEELSSIIKELKGKNLYG